ncbi:pyridoxine 5'-phosphate synthase [bacterium]|nr:pyridoxine 5'-phosphate synthase [bacterium]
MMRLSVHLTPLARFRALGNHAEPDLFTSALAVDLAGADGIVCRLEEDGPIDIKALAVLKKIVRSHLTIEVEPNDGLLRTAMELKPDQVTLAPHSKAASQGLDVIANATPLRKQIRSLHAAGIDVSLQVMPEIEQVKEARKLEADAITLSVARYTKADSADDAVIYLEEIEASALGANRLGLSTLVSFAVDHRNVAPLAALGTIDEVVLGHRLFARSMYVGLDRALGEVRDAVRWHQPRG